MASSAAGPWNNPRLQEVVQLLQRNNVKFKPVSELRSLPVSIYILLCERGFFKDEMSMNLSLNYASGRLKKDIYGCSREVIWKCYRRVQEHPRRSLLKNVKEYLNEKLNQEEELTEKIAKKYIEYFMTVGLGARKKTDLQYFRSVMKTRVHESEMLEIMCSVDKIVMKKVYGMVSKEFYYGLDRQVRNARRNKRVVL